MACRCLTVQRPDITPTLSHAINRPGANVWKGSNEGSAIKSFEMEASHVGDLGCFVFMASCGVVRIFPQILWHFLSGRSVIQGQRHLLSWRKIQVLVALLEQLLQNVVEAHSQA